MKKGLDLGVAYAAMLGRIKAESGEKARLGMAVLMWISHSRRPLQVDELCHAIAIRIGSNDLDNDDIPTISTLLDCCQGLVTVDKGASTVRLIHFTLQKHLYTHPDIFDRAHSTMAETCLTYLNFQHLKDLPASQSPDPRDTPFLQYASLYWGTHMRVELSDRAKKFALQLLDHFESHISAKFLWKSINDESPGYSSGDMPFSALHCVSYFGIPEVTIDLIKVNRLDVNQRDSLGMTPLIWASKYGREEVVRILLREKRIQPDQHERPYKRTALSWAAGNGREGVVRLFLARQFINPGGVGRQWGKSARVVNHLFSERYVNPNRPSKYGRTPLQWAVENGHEGIVKLLLERKDVIPDIPERTHSHTPLSWAAENGREGIVKLLLARKDVNPSIPRTRYGPTPLSRAAGKGHEGTVKLLLERKDVNPNIPDPADGETPLLLAAENGHEGVVKLLLGRKDVNPDTPNGGGRTPLSWAAENGCERIVKLLLERKDVNPNTPDILYRQTPLLWAARRGHEGIVKLLLERKDVNPDTPDTMYGQTPLLLAAQNGQTPLSLAAQNGHEGIVKLLLGRNDVNPDTPDSRYGQTPLALAAANGHEGIVKLLLEQTDVNPNSSNKDGETPLMLATSYGRQRVVELLQAQRPDAPSDSILA